MELFIFKKNENRVFEVYKHINFDFENTCPNFVFSTSSETELKFITPNSLFSFNFESLESKTIY